MDNFVELATFDDIRTLEPNVGDICFVRDEEQYRRWSGFEWEPVKFEPLQMNIYDLNKQGMNQLPAMTQEQIDNVLESEMIRNFMNKAQNVYYMLLCRELNYYTLFKIDEDEDEGLEQVLLECIQNLGTLKAIGPEDGAIEIWFSTDDNSYVAYFFPYDMGVEVCR